MTTCIYLNSYFEMFILPLIKTLSSAPDEVKVNIIRQPTEKAKRDTLFNLMIAIGKYRDEQHQWISDKDDSICEELESLIRDSTIKTVEVPEKGRRKLYYDLLRLQRVLDGLTTELHSNEITYFVKEMLKCTPHTATHYELLLKSDHMKLYYNRLKCLVTRL